MIRNCFWHSYYTIQQKETGHLISVDEEQKFLDREIFSSDKERIRESTNTMKLGSLKKSNKKISD